MVFTDSHCHLDFSEFESTRPALLNQCVEHNIHRIVVPSVSPDNWSAVMSLLSSSSPINILPCLGIHPWFLSSLTDEHLQALDNTIVKYKSSLAAIGEMGLDGVIALEQQNMPKQLQFFEHQLALCKEHHLPAIIHHRRTHNETIQLLKQFTLPRAGIIHAFSGSYQQACQYIDLGFKLGVGGTITYPRAQKTIKALKKVPIHALVLETDAPAMPLNNQQGLINKPTNIIEIFNTLSSIRSEPKELLAEHIEQNINQLFTTKGNQ